MFAKPYILLHLPLNASSTSPTPMAGNLQKWANWRVVLPSKWGEGDLKERSQACYLFTLKVISEVVLYNTTESSTDDHHLPTFKASYFLAENWWQKLLLGKDSARLKTDRTHSATLAPSDGWHCKWLMAENFLGPQGRGRWDFPASEKQFGFSLNGEEKEMRMWYWFPDIHLRITILLVGSQTQVIISERWYAYWRNMA